jgi:hypothetical protein
VSLNTFTALATLHALVPANFGWNDVQKYTTDLRDTMNQRLNQGQLPVPFSLGIKSIS